MTARLTLICHGSTDAVRAAAFPRDEPLDHHGKTGAPELVGSLPSVDCCWTSPELRARQTAEALGLSADIQPMLRECDYGRWAGKKFREIAADEPDAANSLAARSRSRAARRRVHS
jgi:broad specificity phosphatase PhoE